MDSGCFLRSIGIGVSSRSPDPDSGKLQPDPQPCCQPSNSSRESLYHWQRERERVNEQIFVTGTLTLLLP